MRPENPGHNSTLWVHRYLSGSIYLWACGEKAEDEDDGLTFSDRLIGWLTLLLQGLAYIILIVRAGRTFNSGTERYSVASVSGAMYLLVASTTPDLRAGFALLVDGSVLGHRVFGAGLLIVYALMISAAIRVLVSTASDDASMVTNAVAVLFIADLDEKALKFFLTVPQRWRLFWALHSIGISFALALIAIIYFGDSSELFKESYSGFNLDYVPSWFLWAVNPGAVALCACILSTATQSLSDSFNDAIQNVGGSTCKFIVASYLACFHGSINRVTYFMSEDPWLYMVLVVWLLQGVASWWLLIEKYRYPVAIIFPVFADDEENASSAYNEGSLSSTGNGQNGGLEITKHIVALILSNVALATGFAMKAIRAFCPTSWRPRGHPQPRVSSDEILGRQNSSNVSESRVSSLLMGWGIGYWVTSLLYVLSGSSHKGGWNDAPIVVTIVGYVVIPCFFLAGVFMVADTNFLGTRFGAFTKRTVDLMRNRRKVWYWVVATVLRDILLLWMYICYSLVHFLNNF